MTIPTVPSGRNGFPSAGGYVYRGTKRDAPDALGLAARERQEAFGRAVQAAREAAGLSRRQVSDAARIKPSRMGAIEHGQDKPSAAVLARIAAALKTTPEALKDPAVRCPPAPAAAERREAGLPPADDRRRRSLQPHRGSAGTGPKTPGGAAGTSGSGLLAPPGSAPRSWRVELPAGLELLNSNDRDSHWARRKRITEALRHAAGWMARWQRVPHLERAHILAVYEPPDRRRRDPANLYPSVKAAVDGLVDVGVLPDDDAAHLEGPDMRLGTVHPRGRLVLTITEVSPP